MATERNPFDGLGMVEAADSTAPHSFSYSAVSGARTADYYLAPGGDLRIWVQTMVGRTYDAVNPLTGAVGRLLPRTHPEDPSLFAEKATLVGFGVPEARDAPNPVDPAAAAEGGQLIPPAMTDQYLTYPGYVVRVDYSLRPYTLLTDRNVKAVSSVWFDERGEPKAYTYCNEYDRFVEIDERFDNGLVTATQGQFVFRTDDGERPDGAAFAGQPRIPYPEKTVTMTWRLVPYRYVTSPRSFLRRWALRVNQNPWSVQDYVYGPGEVLYLGYEVARYTQPYPEEARLEDAGRDVVLEAPALEKLCDIKLVFSQVFREPASTPPALPNPNWVAAGHNLLPWFGPGNSSTVRRGYHYASSFDPSDPGDRRFWQPVYESAPLDLLFTDPDAFTPNPEA